MERLTTKWPAAVHAWDVVHPVDVFPSPKSQAHAYPPDPPWPVPERVMLSLTRGREVDIDNVALSGTTGGELADETEMSARDVDRLAPRASVARTDGV